MSDVFRKAACAGLAREFGPEGHSASELWQAPDLTLLGDALPAAPRLPLNLFGAAATYIERAARGASAPPDYVAAILIAGATALMGKSYQVRVSSDWFEPLVVWSALVGPPSSGKTPACEHVRKKLYRLQKDMAETHRTRIERDLQYAEVNKASKHEIDALRDLLDQPPRCVVNDSTSEALARVEIRARRGLLIERDELAGLIEGLERYSAGVDRAYYLEGFTRGAFTIDRVKSGSLFIEDHCFSITGGIQPDRLRSLLTHSGDDDGFMSRLLVFWPDTMPGGPIPKGADHTSMEAALDRIYSLEPDLSNGRATLTLSSEAHDAFDDWYQTERAARLGTLGRIGSAYGKLPGYVARLAGILHVLDWGFDEGRNGLPDIVEECHLAASLVLIENYFVPQIVRAYHGADLSPAEATAAAILQHCRKEQLTEFNLREARRAWGISGARGRDACKRFDEAATLLGTAGWIRPLIRNGGAKDFELNPALYSRGEA
tara:strand:+ start:2465 stop:3934 length:1470 start_codon:yes stop_codon:yes gene_type:complete